MIHCCRQCGREAGYLIEDVICETCITKVKDDFCMAIAGILAKDKGQVENVAFWKKCYDFADVAFAVKLDNMKKGNK